jgi:heptosyltransferase II
MPSAARVRSIGIGLFGAIGDVVLSTPLVESLRSAYPEASITYVVGSTAKPVLEGLKIIDEIIVWPDGANASRFRDIQTALKIALRRFDLTVCLTRAPKLALAFYASGARTRAGFTPLRADWTLNIPVDCDNAERNKEHRTEYFLAVATALGVPWPSPIRTHYVVHDHERLRIDSLLQDAGVDPDRHTLIAIHPGTSRTLIEKRRWAAENFGVVARHLLQDSNNRVVLLGGPDDEDAAAVLKQFLGKGAVDFTGQLTIRETAAMIARAHLLIHNDSSPLHLAGAVGTPVLAIFGYQNAQLWGPRGRFDRVVRRELPCSPCLPEFSCNIQFECIRHLPPETVISVVDSMLAEIPRPKVTR